MGRVLRRLMNAWMDSDVEENAQSLARLAEDSIGGIYRIIFQRTCGIAESRGEACGHKFESECRRCSHWILEMYPVSMVQGMEHFKSSLKSLVISREGLTFSYCLRQHRGEVDTCE